MRHPPDRVFRADEILRTLARHQVDFVVIGGLAVQGHGYIRNTYDLDVIVAPTILNATRLSEALADLEAELRVPGGLSLADPHQLRSAPLISTVTRFGLLDVVHVEHVAGAPKSYEALRDSALVIPYQGIEVSVAGLSDLIRMKRAAGREQDLADIEALTRDLEVDPEST
jgi:predicted nucleotidyltransferase